MTEEPNEKSLFDIAHEITLSYLSKCADVNAETTPEEYVKLYQRTFEAVYNQLCQMN